MAFRRRFRKARRFVRRGFKARRMMFKRRSIRPEIKKIDTTVTAVNTTYNGIIHPCTGVAQGTEVYNRIGNQIFGKKLNIRLDFTGITGNSPLRVLVIRDNMLTSSATIPTLSDIFQNPGTANTTQSFLNLDTGPRYKILRDKVYNNFNAPSYSVRMYVPLNFKLFFTGSGLSDYYRNQVYVVVVSNYANAGSAQDQTAMVTRFYFTDV